MARLLTTRLVSVVMTLLAFLGCAEAPRDLNDFVGGWSAEFSRPPLTQVVHGTIVFDSVATMPRGEVRLLGSFQLDSAREQRHDDLIVSLLGGPDPCLELRGPVMAYKTSDPFLEVEFTPGAGDCGLVGQVSATTLRGSWREPGFSGNRAVGELRIAKRASSP